MQKLKWNSAALHDTLLKKLLSCVYMIHIYVQNLHVCVCAQMRVHILITMLVCVWKNLEGFLSPRQEKERISSPKVSGLSEGN